MSEESWVVAATGIAAFLVAVWGVLSQRRISSRHSTIQYFISMEKDRDLRVSRQIFVRVTSNPGEIATYAQRDKYFTDEASAIRTILNTWEIASIAIQHGTMDFGIVKRYGRGMILRDWELAAPFVHELQRVSGNARIYEEFRTLADWLVEKRPPRRGRFWAQLW